jgi:hypothetical protein
MKTEMAVSKTLRPLLKVKHPLSVAALHRTVSVITPCYNYGHFLHLSASSVLSQEGVNVELIIVDDASTDQTPEICAGLLECDDRVRVIRHVRNAGHVIAYNHGFEEATGDYIVRLDADDLLTPGSLIRAVSLMETYERVGLVYGHPKHFTAAVPSVSRTRTKSWTIWSGGDWLAERCRSGVNCITTPEAMIRGSVARRLGGLRTELKFAQDMELWLRIASVSDIARVNGVDQAFHRDHAGSMSATAGSEIMTDLLERRTVFELLFDGSRSVVAEGPSLARLANRTLAVEALDRACRAYERGHFIDVSIDRLVDFAMETCPDAKSLSEYARLSRRRAVGENLARYFPPFLVYALKRRAIEEIDYMRWQHKGV